MNVQQSEITSNWSVWNICVDMVEVILTMSSGLSVKLWMKEYEPRQKLMSGSFSSLTKRRPSAGLIDTDICGRCKRATKSRVSKLSDAIVSSWTVMILLILDGMAMVQTVVDLQLSGPLFQWYNLKFNTFICSLKVSKVTQVQSYSTFTSPKLFHFHKSQVIFHIDIVWNTVWKIWLIGLVTKLSWIYSGL